MHRKVKGLLSLVITVAMLTATVTPASAEELLAEQPPVEEQPIAEEIEQNEAEQEPVEQTTVVTTQEQPPVEPNGTQEEPVLTPVEEAETVIAELETEVQPPVEEQPIVEEIEPEIMLTPQNVAEPVLASDTIEEYLYDNLTADQRQFRVYAGTDISSDLQLLDIGVTPDADDLSTLTGTILAKLLAGREGDFNFYRLSGWKLWAIGDNGAIKAVEATSNSPLLGTIATKANFLQTANMVNNGTGTSPVIVCQQPILEPVWSCVPYAIPLYGADGNSMDTAITVNAENYNTISLPEIEGVYWKLIYNDTVYSLNTASELWTNATNGIKTVGRDFDVSKAKLQACIDSVIQEPPYNIAGQVGKNGWYISDVVISAKEGYEVRLSETEAWASAVSVTESGAVTLYVKTVDDVELPAVALNFPIDKTAPVISGVENGQTYYSNEIQVVVTDEHLQMVTKNTGAVGVYDNKAYITLNPCEEPYTIFAEDEAGNQVFCTVLVKQAETPPPVQIDKTAPVISGVENGQTYYGDQKVAVTDENLSSVTVNGSAVAISDNRADITLVPSDENYNIVAEDTAGNRTQYTVEVLETWVRDGIMTNGKKNLKHARMYKLGSGQWTVDGDSTVYSGGGTFYVKNGGEYDFKKK